MNFARIMLALLILTLVGLACAYIAGFIPQEQIVDIGLKVTAILGLITVAGLAVSRLTSSK
jgi:hypothetical protein